MTEADTVPMLPMVYIGSMNGWTRLGTERNGLARSDSAKERELWVAFWLTNRQGKGWGGQSERIWGLVCFVWGVEVLCPVRPRKVSQSSCFCKIMYHVLYFRDQSYKFLIWATLLTPISYQRWSQSSGYRHHQQSDRRLKRSRKQNFHSFGPRPWLQRRSADSRADYARSFLWQDHDTAARDRLSSRNALEQKRCGWFG